MTVDDAGHPIAYLALEPGTPVHAQDGSVIGRVHRVLADQRSDIFDGIVIRGGDGDRFADAQQIAAIRERAVTLNLSPEESARLPEPAENAMVAGEDPRESSRAAGGALLGLGRTYGSWLRDLARSARDRLNRRS